MMNQIQSWLTNWEAMHGGPEVMLYDFGGHTAVMPIYKDGTWLTTSICYVCVPGTGKPNVDSPKASGVSYLGGGWFFHAVEIPLRMTRDQLFTALDKAKEALLAGVEEHAKTAGQEHDKTAGQ